jgi:hypothetical protein
MTYYRLVQSREGLPEGATITEDKFKGIPYLSKCYFEPIPDYQLVDYIEYKNENYCIENGIDKMLFYNEIELDLFLKKKNELQYK